MNGTLTLRPGVTPITVLLTVLFFMFAWPLGLLMLAYMLWGDRLPEMKGSARAFARSGSCFGSMRHARQRHGQHFTESGNVAFDEYRNRELKRLDEERRRLEHERRDFEAYVQNLRRAKDQEEFNRFMADRDAPKGDAPL